jgi:hypothetical protein
MSNLVVTCLAVMLQLFYAESFTIGKSRIAGPVVQKIIVEPPLLAKMDGNIEQPTQSRRIIFEKAAHFSAALLLSTPNPSLALASYSQNARNFERLANGDESGGSVYDNNPTAKGARRRRAMTGCKIPSTREEAAEQLMLSSLSEKDCNLKVMDEDAEFMLKAMRALECPTCPYGVKAKR